jgi:hypothetical protein
MQIKVFVQREQSYGDLSARQRDIGYGDLDQSLRPA